MVRARRLVASLGAFAALGLSPALAQQNETVKVDAGSNRHPIDARVYGVAYGDATSIPDLNVPVNRYGGNNTSRYNWQLNADNRGSDWFFESIGDTSATAGERGDTFISMSKGGGAEPLITIPTIGWVAALGPNRGNLASFSVAKYGAQQQTDQYMPDAGNGVATSGQPIAGNDPKDANVTADSLYQQQWVQHIVSKFGASKSGGLKYYILDNEWSIWHSTHRDVHPVGAKMSEVLQKIIDYSSKIKAVDPDAVVIGPEEWGWSGYLYSGYDQQYGAAHGYSSLPDRAANGNMDYLPWLLDQLHQHDQSSGGRSLDIFTVHYYPQGGEFGNDTSTSVQLLRNQSTRSLWDPNYVDQSWINTQVNLISRLKGWVSQYYPNTQVGLTEYNWGAEAHINGATTQADILGILGREGADLATRWTTPDPSTPTYKAIKLYRNYDGNKSTFGDTSVGATVANPDNLSAFASVRSSDGALTIMVVNKYLTMTTQLTLDIANFQSSTGKAHVFQLTQANTIDTLPDVTLASSTLTATLPAQSITLYVVDGQASSTPTPSPTPSASPSTQPSPTPSAQPSPAGSASSASSASAAPPASSAGSGHGGGCSLDATGGQASSLAPLAALVVLMVVSRRRVRTL